MPTVPATPTRWCRRCWFLILAVIGVLNAAVGAWYYLRIVAVMYLRTPLHPVERPRFGPALVAVWLCALATLAVGVYPAPLQQWVRAAVPAATSPAPQSPAPVTEVQPPGR